MYKNAVAQAEQEEEVIRKALQKITEIRNIKNERRIQVCLTSQHLDCLDNLLNFRLVLLRIKNLLGKEFG